MICRAGGLYAWGPVPAVNNYRGLVLNAVIYMYTGLL